MGFFLGSISFITLHDLKVAIIDNKANLGFSYYNCFSGIQSISGLIEIFPTVNMYLIISNSYRVYLNLSSCL